MADTDGDGVPDVQDCDPYSKKNNKVLVCHKGNTICINQSDVQSHLKHGDHLGRCTNTITLNQKVGASKPTMEENNRTFGIYPNPNSGRFTLQLNSKGSKAEVLIVNALGAVVERKQVQLSGKEQTIQLDISHKPAGVYLVKVMGEHGVQTAKLIVRK